MKRKRAALILALAEQHGTRHIERLYMEVYGATFSGNVSPERAVQSVITACEEILNGERKTKSRRARKARESLTGSCRGGLRTLRL